MGRSLLRLKRWSVGRVYTAVGIGTTAASRRRTRGVLTYLSSACVSVLGIAAFATPADGATTTFDMTAQNGTLPGATIGTAYSVQLKAPSVATTYEVTSGSLPVGLTMSTRGLISGVPALPQTALVSVWAYNLDTPVAAEWLNMTVSSGNASLDPTLIPIGNSIAELEGSLVGTALGDVAAQLSALESEIACLATVGCVK